MSKEEEPKMEQSDSDSKSDKIKDEDDWKRVRSAIEHENILVNDRITRFSTVQGFLFTAFSLIFNAYVSNKQPNLGTPYPLLLAVGALGMILCLTVLLPLHEARKQIIILDCWWHNKDQDKFSDDEYLSSIIKCYRKNRRKFSRNLEKDKLYLEKLKEYPPLQGFPNPINFYIVPVLVMIVWIVFIFYVLCNSDVLVI